MMRRSNSHCQHQQQAGSSQQQPPPSPIVKRRKKCSKAIRFLRSIFTSPSTSQAGNGVPRSSRCQPFEMQAAKPSSAEISTETMTGRCQHQRCRFHRQGSAKSASWLIEVSVPCVCNGGGLVGGGGSGATASSMHTTKCLPSRRTPSPTPTPSPPQSPQPPPVVLTPLPPLPRPLQRRSSRQTLQKLQDANKQLIRMPHQQSSPASGCSEVIVPEVHRPEVSLLGSDNNDDQKLTEQKSNLREISSSYVASAPTIERRGPVLHVVEDTVKVSSRQLALVPKTLWLRHETAEPLAPLTPATLSTLSAAVAKTTATTRSCAAGSCIHRPPDRLPETRTTILTTTTSLPPLPRRPPPELSKLRAPPVVVRAPRSPLTPSPVRGCDVKTSIGASSSPVRSSVVKTSIGASSSPVRGSVVKTSIGAPSTQSPSEEVTTPAVMASSPLLGRVAGAVRHFDAIRTGVGGVGLGFVARPTCRRPNATRPQFARNFGVGALSVAAAVAPAAPAAAPTVRTSLASPDSKPRPCFRELLAKFEAFDDRRRRQCAAAATAAAEGPVPSRDDDNADKPSDEAHDTPTPSLLGSTVGAKDCDYKEVSVDRNAPVAEASGVEMADGRSMLFRTLKIAMLFLTGLLLGQAVFRMVLAFDGELSDMRARFN